MTSFERRVATVVRRIPRGRVASYSMVADRVRTPGAARAVGGRSPAASRCPRIGWSPRIGRLVRRWPEQSRLLRDEGVPVRDGRVARPIPWWRA